MNDTSPEIEQKVRELFQKKSPIERLKMGCDMYDASRYLVEQAILRKKPHLSGLELQKEVFLRFYRDDFSEEEIEKFFTSLDEYHRNKS